MKLVYFITQRKLNVDTRVARLLGLYLFAVPSCWPYTLTTLLSISMVMDLSLFPSSKLFVEIEIDFYQYLCGRINEVS
jgi:hypothetical protein